MSKLKTLEVIVGLFRGIVIVGKDSEGFREEVTSGAANVEQFE